MKVCEWLYQWLYLSLVSLLKSDFVVLDDPVNVFRIWWTPLQHQDQLDMAVLVNCSGGLEGATKIYCL